MSTERRIKGLKIRQKSVRSSFNLIDTFVGEYLEERDACQLPVRLEHLDKLWSEFQSIQAELEATDDAYAEEQFKERAEFETAYYRVKGKLLSKIKPPASPSMNTSSSSNSQFLGSSSHVRLPDIKLPVFGGTIDSWLNFHDLFLSLVHSSGDLSNIQKFYYLRSSLTGDALKLVQTINISADNYPVAWSLLIEHYHNPARLKQTYLDALFEVRTLKRESASDLHSLVEGFEANVKVLKQLGERTEFWDTILIRMLTVRLDPTTRRDWEEISSTNLNVSFMDLTSFIQRRVTVLQSIGSKPVDTPSLLQQCKKPNQRTIASHGAIQVQYSRKCIVCSEHHPLYMCQQFSKLDTEAKEREIRRHHLCRNCLRTGHQVRDCPSSSTCRKCRGRHHTQLCTGAYSVAVNSRTTEPLQATSSASREQSMTSAPATINAPASYASSRVASNCVLLATAIVTLVDDNGTEHIARALLDSGSECCFITESLSQLVRAQQTNISVPIRGIGQSETFSRYKIIASLRSRVGNFTTSTEFLVLPKITIDLPSTSVDTSAWNIPSSAKLADPLFYERNPVDIIIGADIFFELFNVPGRIPLGNSFPTLVNSVLGWIVSGKATNYATKPSLVANVATVHELHHLIERFWLIEENDSTPNYSVEELACENHFRCNVKRNSEGRYIVRLPTKQNVINTLGDNRRTAIRRFHMLENRLGRDSHLAQQYTAFMDEYLSLGHMKQVDDYQSSPPLCYHMPHHGVVRAESTTTKLRVVFDASCKTPEGPSLNDTLMVGPTVQQDLRSIIMRSRIRPIMLIADAKQMYRQVLVDERDTPLQRIVWRNAPEQPLKTFELLTVTYGTASAPFLATRILQQLADDEEENFPIAEIYTATTGATLSELPTSYGNWFAAKITSKRLLKNAVKLESVGISIRQKASHFGGLWEAAIRSAQKHFTRVLGTHTLAHDDMETLLAQIECCLNSRPIVPLSEDPSDYEPLTPGHFLVGSSLKAVPDTNITDVPLNRLRKWEQTQKIFQLIWKRWQAEYLSLLQPRTKWCSPPTTIRKNQLVLIKDEIAPPMSWPRGRIVDLYPGTDGITRVVTVQTPSGRFTRPISKLCILPMPPTQESSNDQIATQ